MTNTPLDILPYAEGASWNPERVCLPDTRREILDDMWKWIYAADETKTAEIFWLCDVAGAGKSAIAHTIAQKCFHEGILASSFFFDRSTPDRRNPLKLFSTIARDLAGLNNCLVGHVTQVLANDRSVASASQSRQFEELILNPVSRHHIDGPAVIVIDGLDEGCDRVTLSILHHRVPKLPGTFRFIVTSRPTDDIRKDLSNVNHILCKSLEIQSEANQHDIALYIRERLQHISSRRDLYIDWPGEQRFRDFTQQAEGLFVWAFTVSEYLLCAVYPDRKLSKLLYERNMGSLPAEAKMDALYAEVLSACAWDDEDFIHDYLQIIGTIMAAKTPLSSVAIQSIHRKWPTLDVKEILRPLSSVLTGFFNEGQPIRVLHHSFRDFLTIRAQSSSLHERFWVNEKEHSQHMALLCLQVLNEDLNSDISGTGYLSDLTPQAFGIPPIDGSNITEVLWYACRFWADHIIQMDGPVSDTFLSLLRQFLLEKLVVWMEALNSIYPFKPLHEVREWLRVSVMCRHYLTYPLSMMYTQRICPSEPTLIIAISSNKYSSILCDLSTRLSYMDRQEDALGAILEAVDISRQLAADDPITFQSGLASSLNCLFNCLMDLGRREDALEAVREAVDLRRKLVVDHPGIIKPVLAGSLSNLSSCLSDLGRQEDALKVILEGVDLFRQLAADDPAAFNVFLADSLNNLCNRLVDVGRREDALEAIIEAVDRYRRDAENHAGTLNPNFVQTLHNLSNCLWVLGRPADALKTGQEAVDLRRVLAASRPAAFKPDLASSLNNLSTYLSRLGRQDDALQIILEAVDLRRQLAADRPAVFIPDLAEALHTLSGRLSDLGRGEDALEAIQEAVDLRRQLAVERPTVFNPILVGSLNNLSVCLSNIGLREGALEAIQEALGLCRQLAADRPATFNLNLAECLNNLSSCLSDLGRQADALEAIMEAVDLFRQLAANLPAAFNPNLAHTLNFLSDILSSLGRQQEALETSSEAVDLRRKLAADCPAAFNSALATSLDNYSNLLSDLGHQEDALKAIMEAVYLYRQLAGGRPVAFDPSLAKSLHNLSVHLLDLGRREGALEAIQETANLRRKLAADNPAVFNQALVQTLHALADQLSNLGRRENALEAMREAEEIIMPV